MTNFEYLCTCDIETLAHHLIAPAYKIEYEYSYEEEPREIIEEGWQTSDGKFFYYQDFAIEHQIDWLNRQH